MSVTRELAQRLTVLLEDSVLTEYEFALVSAMTVMLEKTVSNRVSQNITIRRATTLRDAVDVFLSQSEERK